MSEKSSKRRDYKGRVLKVGESQRKDMIYQYRYTNTQGKRRYIYAPTLQELREKEKEVQKLLDEGINYTSGQITVLELLRKYISLKQGVRDSTKYNYAYVLRITEESSIGSMKIQDVRVSTAKQWFLDLIEQGRGYGCVSNVKSVYTPAFRMAYEEDAIRKNPFDFKLSDVTPNTIKKRVALTPEQQESFLEFVKNDKKYGWLYDTFIVLLHTGLRIGELCGLTISDLDFTERTISINHQLQKNHKTKQLYIEKPKTESGIRRIPMVNIVRDSLLRILDARPVLAKEPEVDGYTGFVFVSPKGKLRINNNYCSYCRFIVARYNQAHPDDPLQVTPHVLRHTFCTNILESNNVSIKTAQMLLGHSRSSTTMDVYAHFATYEQIATQLHAMYAPLEMNG